ncbi:hypothetical protein DB346_14940 [Verrucomicrobia bacterium LW23]|nr:hypothetical protein DB346_14940 [Verrucomicrobia bacterium LW23]
MADLFVFTDARGVTRGPADVATLRAWLSEGLLAEDTRLIRAGAESTNSAPAGDSVLARDVLGSTAATGSGARSEPGKAPAPAAARVEDRPAGAGLRPLTNSEMLDRAFQVYRHHFLQLFIMACMINGPVFLLHTLTRYAGLDKFGVSLLSLDGNLISRLPETQLLVMTLGAMLAALCMEWLGVSVLTTYVADLYLERRVTVGRAFWSLRGKVLRLLVTNALRSVLFLFLACLPFVSLGAVVMLHTYGYLNIWTGILMGLLTLALVVPMLLYTVHTQLVPQTVMLENRFGFNALIRSSTITRYDPRLGPWYWGETRLSMLLLVVLVTTLLVMMVSSAPTALTQERLGLGLGIADSSAIIALQQVLYFLGINLVSPLLSVLGATVFYYDIRVRREGYDMEVMAMHLEAADAARHGQNGGGY